MSSQSRLDLQNFILSNKDIKTFFKNYANIDENELLNKAFDIYTKAQQVHAYRCIETFKFLTNRILNNPFYPDVKNTWNNKKILDIGCGLGTDLRRMTLDGASQRNLHGLDVEKDFIELGYELFNDSETNEMTFYVDNILEKSTIDKLHIKEKFAIIYSSSVIHLLNKEEIEKFLISVYAILQTNGIFFGQTTGLASPQQLSDSRGKERYLHSKESLFEEFEAHGFRNVRIELQEHKTNLRRKGGENRTRFTMYFYCSKNNNF